MHIVYCHPSEDSLTAEVRDAFISGLKDSGKTHTISDLYQQGFQTDMTEAEYLRDAYYDNTLPLTDDVLVEQALINASDALVFIYPVFWTEAPAKLVGWFGRVWRYGYAYGAESNSANIPDNSSIKPMKVLDKVLFIACAGNSRETLEEQGRLQSMENIMLGDRVHDRAKHKELVLLGGTERSDPSRREAMRIQHTKTAYRLGENF